MEAETQTPSFIAPSGTTAEINGVERTFYAMSLTAFFELNSVAKPIVASLATLLDPPRQNVRERVKSGDAEKTTYDPIATDLVKHGASVRDKAMTDLVDALMNPKNFAILRMLIVDSLHDEYPRGVKLTKEQERAFSEMDLPTAGQIVKALVSANAEALRPLMSGVTETVREAVATVTPRSP